MSASAKSSNTSTDSNDLIGQLVTSGLTKAFDAIKEKVTTNVQENGEQYLDEAVEKITETTAEVVEWAKKHPVKTALAVTALAAVSAFLMKMIATHSSSSSSKAGSSSSSARSSAPAAKKARAASAKSSR